MQSSFARIATRRRRKFDGWRRRGLGAVRLIDVTDAAVPSALIRPVGHESPAAWPTLADHLDSTWALPTVRDDGRF